MIPHIGMGNDDRRSENRTHLLRRSLNSQYEIRIPNTRDIQSVSQVNDSVDIRPRALEQGVDKGRYSRPLRQHYQ